MESALGWCGWVQLLVAHGAVRRRICVGRRPTPVPARCAIRGGHDYGFAGGMDYHVAPDTILGFALAGGGTDWALAQGLGGGRSDSFQVGL
jgi:hypothetical protein